MNNKTFKWWMGALGLAISVDSFSLTRAQFIQQINGMGDAQVWTLLTSSGVGSCKVYDASALAHACNYYFKSTTFRSNNNYDGLPTSNTVVGDNSPDGWGRLPSNYNYGLRSAKQYDSTGCFPAPADGKMTSGGCWAAVNRDGECSLSKEKYAKKVVLQLMADTINDPCNLTAYTTQIPPNTVFSSERMVSTQVSNVRFGGTAGNLNPSKCYLLMSSNATPDNFFGASYCRGIYNRIVSNGGTPQALAGTTGRLLNASSAQFLAQARAIQSAYLSNTSTLNSWSPTVLNVTAGTAPPPGGSLITSVKSKPVAIDAQLTGTESATTIFSKTASFQNLELAL